MSNRLSTDHFLTSNPEETISRIRAFIKNYKDQTKASRLIIGMSGGLDSSVATALCSLAVGGKQVLGVSMPEQETRNENSLKNVRLIAKKYSIKLLTIDLTSPVRALSATLPKTLGKTRKVLRGNLKARLRATVLYYLANRHNGLVVGTGDKSEIMIGYFTKYGDGACDIQPLADLYKTAVRNLAIHLQLPESIYSKPSSPELWPGQTAEKELGLEYEKLDPVLWGLERWMTIKDIAEETGIPVRTVEKIRSRWLGSEHKRKPPLTLKLGYRTAGSDLRLPRTGRVR